MRALLGIAALLGLAGQAQAAESPALEGVWSGTIGTPASVAASRILAARWSMPLATTIGADEPVSYLSATA